jgi:hypothetical protein
VTPAAELQACAEHMRALGWYESHLFGHYYTSRASKAVYAVAFDADHWALGYTIGLGVYKVTHVGNTLDLVAANPQGMLRALMEKGMLRALMEKLR